MDSCTACAIRQCPVADECQALIRRYMLRHPHHSAVYFTVGQNKSPPKLPLPVRKRDPICYRFLGTTIVYTDKTASRSVQVFLARLNHMTKSVLIFLSGLSELLQNSNLFCTTEQCITILGVEYRCFGSTGLLRWAMTAHRLVIFPVIYYTKYL